MIGERTRTIIIGVVTAVWAINFGAGFFVKDYSPSESINGIFMAIVGGLFALGATRHNKGGDDKEDSGPSKKPEDDDKSSTQG